VKPCSAASIDFLEDYKFVTNCRSYGTPPFLVAVIHGGPGAPGEMAPVARELSRDFGVLEPLQAMDSLEGQVMELKSVLERTAQLPVVLIGYSWGAFLGFILAARHPDLVRKLILVGSGPFESSYAELIMPTRLKRLTEEERREFEQLKESLDDLRRKNQNRSFTRMGEILSKADHYDPIDTKSEVLGVDANVYQKVWGAAEQLRKSGDLLALGRQILCPVVAIHGDYDPHPADGIEKPLSTAVKNFKFILLTNCGHAPWLERQAKDQFFATLRQELR
jgi:pimeloyl-ACP methyl ester carboxylesterase